MIIFVSEEVRPQTKTPSNTQFTNYSQKVSFGNKASDERQATFLFLPPSLCKHKNVTFLSTVMYCGDKTHFLELIDHS